MPDSGGIGVDCDDQFGQSSSQLAGGQSRRIRQDRGGNLAGGSNVEAGDAVGDDPSLRQVQVSAKKSVVDHGQALDDVLSERQLGACGLAGPGERRTDFHRGKLGHWHGICHRHKIGEQPSLLVSELPGLRNQHLEQRVTVQSGTIDGGQG